MQWLATPVPSGEISSIWRRFSAFCVAADANGQHSETYFDLSLRRQSVFATKRNIF
jgi:hypothetical protein